MRTKRPNFKKMSHQLLKQWMADNNLSGKYCIHHRDDTDECRAYNAKDAHYNMWGFNPDGTFEYGKYVVYMSRSEHITHHHKGKIVSAETRDKISKVQTGRRLSDEHKRHISENSAPPWKGKHLPDELKVKLSKAHKDVPLSDIHKAHIKDTMHKYSEAYKAYKNNGGTMTWHQFRRSLISNE